MDGDSTDGQRVSRNPGSMGVNAAPEAEKGRLDPDLTKIRRRRAAVGSYRVPQ